MVTRQAQLTTRHINFNAKFPCRRGDLALFLHAALQNGNDRSAIMSMTGHGVNFYRGFRSWAIACLLWDPSTMQLTVHGEKLLKHDSQLIQSTSAWILHALLCRSNPFWQWFFGNFLPGRTSFSFEAVVSALAEESLVLSSGLLPYVRAILTTYCKPEALGVLGILTQDSANQLRVVWMQTPPPAVYAWALYTYVQEHTGGQSQEVGLPYFLRDPTGPGVAFFSNTHRAEGALEDLSGKGWVALRRYARPYTLVVEVSHEDQLWREMFK